MRTIGLLGGMSWESSIEYVTPVPAQMRRGPAGTPAPPTRRLAEHQYLRPPSASPRPTRIAVACPSARAQTSRSRIESPVGCLMLRYDGQRPELLPVLSRGQHRSPRKGACFMEFASLLAGERWSDHPACTHPLLAAVARHVNDHTSDAGRSRLAGLIPSVIGLTGDDPHIDARIALRSATIALPVVAADRQRVMAVSVLASERVLAELDGRPVGALEAQSRAALAQAPHAAAWADRFVARGGRPPVRRFRRQAAPTIVRNAVEGIAQACVPDPDAMLRDLLVQAIAECAAWVGRNPNRGATIDTATWVTACRLTATKQSMVSRAV
jgi:hypothetical protein